MGEKIEFTKVWIFLVVIVVATVAVVGFGWLKFGKKAALDLNRKAIKHSIQYSESVRSEVNNMVRKYRDVQAKIAEYEAANQDGTYDVVINTYKINAASLITQIELRVKGLPPECLTPEVRSLVTAY